jgi:hypothetical protein
MTAPRYEPAPTPLEPTPTALSEYLARELRRLGNLLRIVVLRQTNGTIRLPSLAADPATAANGDCYYNTTTDKARVYEGGHWKNLA